MRPLLDLLDLLWPRYCLACEVLLRAGAGSSGPEVGAVGHATASEAPPLSLCVACLRRLSAIDPLASCATCAVPLARAGVLQRCGRCLADPPEFDRLTALWRYESPLKEVVRAFKFGRLDFLGAHLARALGRELAGRQNKEPGWTPPDLIVPLPLPWPRRFARGFNQTELLATPLASDLGLPCARALTRPLLAPHQTGKRRAERARGAPFRVPDPKVIAGRSILVIDDVLTTGATARGASSALRRAGALRVEVAVIGWTPLSTPGSQFEPVRKGPPGRPHGKDLTGS